MCSSNKLALQKHLMPQASESDCQKYLNSVLASDGKFHLDDKQVCNKFPLLAFPFSNDLQREVRTSISDLRSTITFLQELNALSMVSGCRGL